MDLEFARTFYELVVYQKARTLQGQVLDVSRNFPAEERYSLTDQIRRASRSIGGQIAEGWGKRTHPKHFVSKLTDATSEALETQHWLITAVDSNYLSREIATALFQHCHEICRMLAKMMQRHENFCLPNPSTLREDPDEFFVSTHHADPFSSVPLI